MEVAAKTVLQDGGHTKETRWIAGNAPKDGMQPAFQFAAQSAPAVMLGHGAASLLREMQVHAETAVPENFLLYMEQLPNLHV